MEVKMTGFNNIPEDPDTRILKEDEIKIDTIAAFHQHWGWEGIVAESIIFHEEGVADFSDEELFEKIKANCTIHKDSRFTIKRNTSGYTFINFNFQDFEDLLL